MSASMSMVGGARVLGVGNEGGENGVACYGGVGVDYVDEVVDEVRVSLGM